MSASELKKVADPWKETIVEKKSWHVSSIRPNNFRFESFFCFCFMLWKAQETGRSWFHDRPVSWTKSVSFQFASIQFLQLKSISRSWIESTKNIQIDYSSSSDATQSLIDKSKFETKRSVFPAKVILKKNSSQNCKICALAWPKLILQIQDNLTHKLSNTYEILSFPVPILLRDSFSKKHSISLYWRSKCIQLLSLFFTVLDTAASKTLKQLHFDENLKLL